MNVSGIFSHSSLVRTHEFSSKFRYNWFATSIETRGAHAWMHSYATCIHMQKYLFESVPQGRIDYIRSSLGATLNFLVFEILALYSGSAMERTAFNIREKSDKNLFQSQHNTPPTPWLSIQKKEKKRVSDYMISIPWLFWRLIFQRVFPRFFARRCQRHTPYHHIAIIQIYATLLSVSTSSSRHNNEALKFICLNCTIAPKRKYSRNLSSLSFECQTCTLIFEKLRV